MASEVQIQELLKNYGFDVGYGFFIGFTVGYAVKKFLKLFLFVLGVYFITLIWLQHVGVVTIHWDLVQQLVQQGQSNAKHYLEALQKSVPFAASFGAGFAVGFKMG